MWLAVAAWAAPVPNATLAAALTTFLQHDGSLARAVLLKLQAVSAALERSSFFHRNVFLRSALLLTYDDDAREGGALLGHRASAAHAHTRRANSGAGRGRLPRSRMEGACAGQPEL